MPAPMNVDSQTEDSHIPKEATEADIHCKWEDGGITVFSTSMLQISYRTSSAFFYFF